MDGNLSSGNMISGAGGSFDLQNSMRVHHQQHNNPFTLHQHHLHQPQSNRQQIHPSIHENFPLRMGAIQDCDRHTQTISLVDFSKGERGKSSISDEDEPSFAEDGHDSRHDDTRGKSMSPWQRVKWSDPMVRLLITAVSYIGEDAAMEYGGGSRRKYSNLQKKGKWKSVSKVMAERGHFVSPQQCEDKFNDLNKRYKRLNEILGRGTSCEVVENPSLLDIMDHVSDKGKEEVRKILSSKHLYYEEMCSYHNGNRLHLPPDLELQRSLRIALKTRDDHETNDGRKGSHEDDHDDEDHDAYMDDHDHDHDHDEYDDHHPHHHGLQLDPRTGYGAGGVGEGSSKRAKQCENFSSQAKNLQGDMSQGVTEGMKTNMLQDQWMKHRLLQLEEQKIQIQSQMLELEKERFKWQRFRRKKDRELESMRMENERMKLENEQMSLELKRKEMGSDLN
ncbi:uncharacterized protein LOC111906507 [Lactuca sativa]|uniref:Myb/SANT-like DNA-binding domain-containing protein n=1 Tax=Lactuca sativa TaxID=4236 RepID=A0A9R1WKI3_LACSA|nr:uncharacterized protein LOC111906507 [Lactuca sativa]KAJ0225479.1 hypothetical protein LSAT_V11C100003090 [Lactuca sativa]